MGHRRKRQTGPQRHAEGQHGEQTHRHFIETLQSGGNAERKRTESRPVEGHHRLEEQRRQHDPAEKNAEKTEVIRKSRAP